MVLGGHHGSGVWKLWIWSVRGKVLLACCISSTGTFWVEFSTLKESQNKTLADIGNLSVKFDHFRSLVLLVNQNWCNAMLPGDDCGPISNCNPWIWVFSGPSAEELIIKTGLKFQR